MPEKIVRFDKWCESCVYKDANPDKVNENPCNNCLYIPVNIDSGRPIFWKSKDNKKGPWL